MKTVIFLALSIIFTNPLKVESQSELYSKKEYPIAGVSQTTPSKSMYFSWINNGWEGGSERQTMINCNFFKWLHDTYGMNLDIYLLDSGNMDGSLLSFTLPYRDNAQQAYEISIPPIGEKVNLTRQVLLNNRSFYCGAPNFKRKYPNGLLQISKAFDKINTRLGMWLGPDGYGESAEDATYRREQVISLARDYNMALFKFDNCCSSLRFEKIREFTRTMKEVRSFVPDLISLNHRINLDEEGLKHMSTFLWEGQETYVDVLIKNRRTATHARAANLDRGNTPQMQRLTEDHGVCLSSCLDYWQDDLIMQTFNRNLIIAPEIYGNPWLLQDHELAEMASIFNLHKKYNKILVNGKLLPEDRFGKHAVSRGDDKTRFLSMVNLNWNRVSYSIPINDEIGIEKQMEYEVRQYHPVEKVIGVFKKGESFFINVDPFRAILIGIEPLGVSNLVIKNISFKILRNIHNKPIELELLSTPGRKCSFSISARNYSSMSINEKKYSIGDKEKSFNIEFEGKPLRKDYHRDLKVKFKEISAPFDIKALLEATFYAADNNALEVRSLNRAGASEIPEVNAARNAFFKDSLFVQLGIWDKQLFDGEDKTTFCISPSRYEAINPQNKQINSAFRLDIGKSEQLDSLIFSGIPLDYICDDILATNDLLNWDSLFFIQRKCDLVAYPDSKEYRYFQIIKSPQSVSEIRGYKKRNSIDRSKWEATNLFPLCTDKSNYKVYKSLFKLSEAAPNSYICVPIDGYHGNENVYVSFKIDGKYVGSPERITSYPANAWEGEVVKSDSNYTYLLPVLKEYVKKNIEVFVIIMDGGNYEFSPSAWITTANPYVTKKVILERY